jgi:hypothetical protein
MALLGMSLLVAMTQGVVGEANRQNYLEYLQAFPPKMAEKFIGL